jgi:hypothetical protein
MLAYETNIIDEVLPQARSGEMHTLKPSPRHPQVLRKEMIAQ